MFLFREQLALKVSEVNGLKNICLFLITVYVKAWLESSSVVGGPFNDLMFLQKFKKFESTNKGISSIALKKFCNHLWYGMVFYRFFIQVSILPLKNAS